MPYDRIVDSCSANTADWYYVRRRLERTHPWLVGLIRRRAGRPETAPEERPSSTWYIRFKGELIPVGIEHLDSIVVGSDAESDIHLPSARRPEAYARILRRNSAYEFFDARSSVGVQLMRRASTGQARIEWMMPDEGYPLSEITVFYIDNEPGSSPLEIMSADDVQKYQDPHDDTRTYHFPIDRFSVTFSAAGRQRSFKGFSNGQGVVLGNDPMALDFGAGEGMSPRHATVAFQQTEEGKIQFVMRDGGMDGATGAWKNSEQGTYIKGRGSQDFEKVPPDTPVVLKSEETIALGDPARGALQITFDIGTDISEIARLVTETEQEVGSSVNEAVIYPTAGLTYIWQAVRIGPDFHSGDDVYKGYPMVEPEDIPQAVRILKELGQRRKREGKGGINFKWLVSNDEAALWDRFAYGRYALQGPDPRIAIYADTAAEIQEILTALALDPRWQPIEARRRQSFAGDEQTPPPEVAPRRAEVDAFTLVRDGERVEFRSLSYNLQPGLSEWRAEDAPRQGRPTRQLRVVR